MSAGPFISRFIRAAAFFSTILASPFMLLMLFFLLRGYFTGIVGTHGRALLSSRTWKRPRSIRVIHRRITTLV